MGSMFERILPEHESFIKQQHMFFVGVAPHFNMIAGARQIIVSNIESVKTSCGFSVPLYSFEGERNLLIEWANNKGEDGLVDYWKSKNMTSMDGIRTPLGEKLSQDG